MGTEKKETRRASSSAMLPSVKPKPEPGESTTARHNISDILRIPRPGPYYKIITAASTALTSRALVASAVALLPLVLVAAFLSLAVRGVETDGRRSVLELAPALLVLVGSAGAVSVAAFCARKRVEGLIPRPGPLAAWWASRLRTSIGLPIALGFATIACKAFISLITGIPGFQGILGTVRIVPLAIAAAMVACLAALAVTVTYVSAIGAIENCGAGESLGLLATLWKRTRAQLLLHFTVIALVTGGIWIASEWLVSRIYALANVRADAGSVLATIYDDALFRTLSLAPPLAMLGAFGVASYLLLRQPAEDHHGLDKDR